MSYYRLGCKIRLLSRRLAMKRRLCILMKLVLITVLLVGCGKAIPGGTMDQTKPRTSTSEITETKAPDNPATDAPTEPGPAPVEAEEPIGSMRQDCVFVNSIFYDIRGWRMDPWLVRRDLRIDRDRSAWIGLSKFGQLTVKDDGGKKIYPIGQSTDGTRDYFVAYDDSTNDLWSYDGTEFSMIAEKVASIKISFKRNVIAYTISDDIESGKGHLYLCEDEKRQQIAKDVREIIAISPDGKAVIYDRYSDGKVRYYLYDGQERALEEGLVPAAVSNGGEYLYFEALVVEKGYYSLFVQKGTDSSTRVELLKKTNDGRIRMSYLNETGTQFIGCDEEGTWFWKEDREQRQKLSKQKLELLVSAGLKQSMSDSLISFFKYLGIGSLTDMFYTCDGGIGDNIYYLNNRFELIGIIGGANQGEYDITPGNTLYYLNGGQLWRFDPDGEEKSVCVVDNLVKEILVSHDGSTVFYIGGDGKLYTIRFGEKPVPVAETEVDDVIPVGENGFIYTTAAGLFFTNGGESRKVLETESYLVLHDLWHYAIVETNDGELFFTVDGLDLISLTKSGD